MFVHSCLSVLLTVISHIVFICTIIFEPINEEDDDDNVGITMGRVGV